jgi:UDP-glucuronate 4-epimerase
MNFLVTGAAGFIGFHVCRRLAQQGHVVHGMDNLNPYYDVRLKQARLKVLETSSSFRFYEADLTSRSAIEQLFAEAKPQRVIHLAAQAGVRYSITNPHAYAESNLVGFLNILEACRQHRVEHLVYASSSSVYGANTVMPFSVHHNVDHPLSLYAATKKANELMAHTYSHLYSLRTTGLRFFTVYGPWGRPDMAMFIFTKSIIDGTAIPLFNHGRMRRDFTYIDDIVEGVLRVTENIPTPNAAWDSAHPDPGSSKAPYRIYNIGNNQPVDLLYLIQLLEENIGKKAVLNPLPMQPGDVQATYADVRELTHDVGFKPSTPIEVGVKNFVSWYREYYQIR